VPVLADDGHLWLRAAAGPEARWTDRGNPPGGRIFALVGAGPLSGSSSGLPFVAVAADDGHLWLNKPEAASAWVDLGAPATGEQVVAGIGAMDVTLTGGTSAIEVVVVGSPSGHVWTRGWSPESTAGRWADLGNPTDRRIQAAIGLVPNVAASGASTFIVAGDMQLWVRRKAGPDEQWTRWGRPHTSPGFGNGRGAVWPLAHRFATAVMIATDRRVWIPLPPELNRELFGALAWAEQP
jgi:uncharacterized protein YaeQ